MESEDDKFMHVTCHLDEALKQKIRKGEYVELEKLLPRQNMCGYGEELNRMSLFHKEGETYFAPSQDKKLKIWNVGMWDKAFRVYLAIYSAEYPHRTTELMQYIQNIHHAAGKYKWDNVAYYDYVFRHLMEQYPHRSWAKTYTQGWTYAMCDPLTHASHRGSGESSGNRKERKLNACWKFNRGVVCDYGQKCKYPHRCTYCGSTTHGAHACFKKQRKSEASSSGTTVVHNNATGGGHDKKKKQQTPSVQETEP